MARPAVRRPPTRRPAEFAPVTAATQLAPLPVIWARDSVVCAAAGVGGWGAAPLLAYPQWGIPALGVGVAAAVVRGVTGRRAQARAELTDRLVEALTPTLGLRSPDRRTVKLRSWTRGWPGHPRRIELRYAPGIDDSNPDWLADVAATTSRRLLESYAVARHDRRRARLRLVLAGPEEIKAEKPLVQARAERTVIELLGSTTTITKVTFDDDQLVQLVASHEAGTRLAAPQYRARIERVISTMLPGRWRARWDLEGDTVTFEVRPTLPSKVDHPMPVITKDNQYRLPLAVQEDGGAMSWNMRGTAPHLLVCGKTGTGKTVTITGVVMEAAYRGWRVWICDPKTVEFIGLRRWPNVQLVATAIEHMVVVILKAQQEMERRYSLVESELAEDDEFEPLVLVLDEYRDFVGMVTAWWARIKVKGMPTKCPVFEAVSSLARKGRTARIHVIMGTQRPDAEFLSGEMRDNFASRMSLGGLSPQGAMMMWEAAYIGVSIPRGVPGRGTAVDDDERPVEVQGYWTPDPRRAEKKANAEDLAVLERLRPEEPAHRPLKVSLADELLYDLDADPGKDDPAPNWWAAIQEAQLVPALDFELSPKASTWELTKRLTGTTPVVEASAELADDDPETIDGGDGADELDEDFDVEQDVPARRVRPGDRLLVEPALDLWAVVEFAEPDIDDEDLVCIDWRGDTDEAGSTSLPISELVSIRRPLIEAAEQ